jgi:4-carboxymuconolactone decarboxylase
LSKSKTGVGGPWFTSPNLAIMPTREEDDPMPESELYRKGAAMRRQLMGEATVERAARDIYRDPVMKKFIDVATETVFGALWTRPGLDLKTRALICVVSDAATGREPELGLHLRMALRQGWTEEELTEVLLHLSGYVGGADHPRVYDAGEQGLCRIQGREGGGGSHSRLNTQQAIGRDARPAEFAFYRWRFASTQSTTSSINCCLTMPSRCPASRISTTGQSFLTLCKGATYSCRTDQHHRFSGALRQVMNSDAVGFEHPRRKLIVGCCLATESPQE